MFKNRFYDEINIDFCRICNMFKSKLKLKQIESNIFNSNYLNEIITQEQLQYPIIICDKCSSFLKQDHFPVYSILNNLNLIDPPDCIKNLNLYERILIQTGRCFQTIIKLKPYGKKNLSSSELISAVQGLSVHLPLPFDATVKNLNQIVEPSNVLKIILDGLPTKNKKIWRSLVDLKKVYTALNYLKSIGNSYYQDIDIDKINFNLDKCKFNDSDGNESDNKSSNKEFDNKDSMILTQNAHYKTLIENQYSVHTIGNPIKDDSDIKLYSTRKIEADPYNDQNKDRDHMCFPHIFILGKGGFYDERKVRILPAQYPKWILKNKNPIARRDIPYLFSLENNKDIKGLDYSIFASLRATKMPVINKELLLDKLNNNDPVLESKLTSYFGNITGSKEYWNFKMNDLEVIDENLGPATFFITLSSAEYFWPECKEFIAKMNPDLEEVDDYTISSLFANDPVSFAIFFEARWRSMFNQVIKGGVLGVVEHYFWRYEYHFRGAPHVHMKLWISNAPILGVNSNKEIIDFIDSYISCAIETGNNELDELVRKFQIHKCTKSCQRFCKSFKNGAIKCRYGYPKLPCKETKINGVKKAVESRRKGKKLEKLYSLIRNYECTLVNDYNPILLLIWRANMEIQFLGEKSMILNRYVTTYITKADKSASESLWDSVNKN